MSKIFPLAWNGKSDKGLKTLRANRCSCFGVYLSFCLSLCLSVCLSFVCGRLRASAGVLGTSWKPLGSLLELPAGVPERLRTAVAHVTANFPHTVASCVRLGCVFASSWRRLGASWARLGRILAGLGRILVRLGGVLGTSFGHLVRSGTDLKQNIVILTKIHKN